MWVLLAGTYLNLKGSILSWTTTTLLHLSMAPAMSSVPCMYLFDLIISDNFAHFMQGILKHMKGAGEPEWTSQDYNNVISGALVCQTPKFGVLRGVWVSARGPTLIIAYCNRAPQKNFPRFLSKFSVVPRWEKVLLRSSEFRTRFRKEESLKDFLHQKQFDHWRKQ